MCHICIVTNFCKLYLRKLHTCIFLCQSKGTLSKKAKLSRIFCLSPLTSTKSSLNFLAQALTTWYFVVN